MLERSANYPIQRGYQMTFTIAYKHVNEKPPQGNTALGNQKTERREEDNKTYCIIAYLHEKVILLQITIKERHPTSMKYIAR